MWILSFDTTTNFCQICLAQDQKLIKRFSSEMTFGQSEVLIPQIKEILDENHLMMPDISLINVCTGPGSFTGVRSSIAVSRAFKLANPSLTLCGVNAFDSYAFDLSYKQISDLNAVIIETKREDFYVAYYDENLKKISTPKTAYKDEIIEDLKHRKVTLTGDGVERFLSLNTGLQIHDVLFAPCPDIFKISLLGFERYQQKRTDFPKPLYLKAADICVK